MEKSSGRLIPEVLERFLQLSSMSGAHCKANRCGREQGQWLQPWRRLGSTTKFKCVSSNPGSKLPERKDKGELHWNSRSWGAQRQAKFLSPPILKSVMVKVKMQTEWCLFHRRCCPLTLLKGEGPK